MERQDLTGKVALITGASAGIGAATARLLAAHGVQVVLAARRRERLDLLVRELGADRALAAPGDVCVAADVTRMVDSAVARFGRVDILFANAGVFRQGAIADVPLEDLLAQIETNVSGVLRCIKAVLPQMIARRSGDILVTSSISGHQDIDNEAVYSASKHAVATLVAILRRELVPHRIRVGCISPAIVLNEIWGITDPDEIARGLAEHRGLASEDVAELVLHMLQLPARITMRDVVVMGQAQVI